MKLPAIVAAAIALTAGLTGCVAVPVAEPVVYAPPPPVVVVRPAYAPHYYYHRPYWRRW